MRRSKGQALWVHNHPSGARVVLAPGTESKELAAAVLSMVAKTRASQAVAVGPFLEGSNNARRRDAHSVSGHWPESRNPVRLAKTIGPCNCGDCLGCDVQAMRDAHRDLKPAKAISESRSGAMYSNDSKGVR